MNEGIAIIAAALCKRTRGLLIAAALGVLCSGAAPAQHWYAEDTKSPACTTLEHAYEFYGGPRDPDQLLAAFASHGMAVDVIRKENEGVVILRARNTSLPIPIFTTAAACDASLALRQRAPVASVKLPAVQRWYTEDTRSRTCTTLERAYDFIGSPADPNQLLRALAKLGTLYDIIRNDEAGVILQARISKLPIPVFRSAAACNTALREVLKRRPNPL